MKSISSFIKRHQLSSFFVMAYGIAWGVILVVAGSKGFRADRLQLADVMLMFAAMLLGPSLAGILLTAIVDGKTAVRSLLARMGRWRVGVRWYMTVLLFPILILAVLMLLTILVSPLFTPGFTAIGLVIGLVAGFLEEIGWTGFALPRLQLKRSPLAASVVLGILWGFWHLLADYFGNYANMGVLWFPYFLFGFVAAMTATRLLIAWVYNHTGSILLAQLMHTSSTGFLYALGISATAPFGPSGYALSFVSYAAALWIVVAFLIARYGNRFAQQAFHMPIEQTNEPNFVSPD